MFHEFGHALHGMFASQNYPTLSGTNVARDFVEFPSQFNENWALDQKILPHYAVNVRTGQPIPQDLVQKILAARTFNQGYEVGEALEAARLDLAEMYRGWAGHDPSIQPYIDYYGLNGDGAAPAPAPAAPAPAPVTPAPTERGE
jgi:Zn-dependent oligopeptidase